MMKEVVVNYQVIPALHEHHNVMKYDFNKLLRSEENGQQVREFINSRDRKYKLENCKLAVFIEKTFICNY